MKRTNLIKKSINLALSVLVAGSIVAVGADGSTLASIFGNNDAIITSVVDAAEVAQIPWSTAYVYGLLPIDLSTGGQGGAADGSYVSMDYYSGSDQSWVTRFTTAVTTDGQTLQFQYMQPISAFGFSAPGDGFYMFCDSTQLKRLSASTEKLNRHQHLWEYTKDELVSEATTESASNWGINWYDSIDEGLYYRITLSYNGVAANGATITQALASLVEVKATGEIYGFYYSEPLSSYNDILAKEIIYSCVPTKLQ